MDTGMFPHRSSSPMSPDRSSLPLQLLPMSTLWALPRTVWMFEVMELPYPLLSVN